MAAKKEISGFIKLQIKGGQANPAPPVGPALGQRGVNIMEFCKAFNDKTIESKEDTLKTLREINTKTTPEVHYSSDEMLVMSVLHELDGNKMIIMAFVTFKNGKAIQMISAKGEPA